MNIFTVMMGKPGNAMVQFLVFKSMDVAQKQIDIEIERDKSNNVFYNYVITTNHVLEDVI